MFDNILINRSSSKAVGVGKGGLKFDKNNLSPAVQKIQAFKGILGNKCLKYFYVFITFY